MGDGRVMGADIEDSGRDPLQVIRGTDAMTDAGGGISIGWESVVSGSVLSTVGGGERL